MTHRQNDHLGLRKTTENALGCIDPTQLRQHEIHDDHVRLEVGCYNNRLLPCCGGSDHLHVPLLLEDDCNAVAHDAVIVGNEDPDGWQHFLAIHAIAARWAAVPHRVRALCAFLPRESILPSVSEFDCASRSACVYAIVHWHATIKTHPAHDYCQAIYRRRRV